MESISPQYWWTSKAILHTGVLFPCANPFVFPGWEIILQIELKRQSFLGMGIKLHTQLPHNCLITFFHGKAHNAMWSSFSTANCCMKTDGKAQRSALRCRRILPEIEGGTDSKHPSVHFTSTTLHFSFKTNAIDKTWKAFSLMLLKYNIHEKCTYSIVQLSKYLLCNQHLDQDIDYDLDPRCSLLNHSPVQEKLFY